MAAPAHPRATPDRRGRRATALPWWAVALPAAAFALLLALVLDPADAHAATGGHPILDLLAQLRQALPY